MKKLVLIVIFISVVGCKKEDTKNKAAKNTTSEEKYEKPPTDRIIGSWVGDFDQTKNDGSDNVVYTNKITVLIKNISGKTITGQSIVAGNVRPFVGFYDAQSDYKYTFAEPGDDKNDGIFKFNFVDNTLKGIWIANNPKLAVSEREYVLKPQKFRYNPNLMMPSENLYVDWYHAKNQNISYEDEDENGKKIIVTDQEQVYKTAGDVITKLNASTTKLSENDLKNLKKLELEIIRNTIFARHGYTFKKRTYRQFFDPVDWYVPVSNDVSKDLTPLEIENIALLTRFEKYAEDHYDSFGR
jgi:YARHG domain